MSPDPELVEAIAARVVELSREAPTLMTVDEVAAMLQVRPEWVYEHADELGAYRLGSGTKGRLRFDRHRVLGRLEAPTVKRERRPRKQRPGASRPVELLPIGRKR
jgi:hypothetical protein